MRLKGAISLATVLAAIWLASPAFSAEDQNLTLQEAVEKGVLTNPEYAIVADDRRAVDEELKQARALYLPSIDARAEGGWERTDTPSINDESLMRKRVSLTLTQLLFDGWGTKKEIERQEARVRSTSSRVGEAAEFSGLDTVEGFFEVLRQRDLLAIAQANVDDHLRILNKIEEGAKAGTVTDGDLSQAHARLAQAKATVSSIQEALRRAESLFVQKTGDFPGSLVFPDVPRSALPPSVDDAVRTAITMSPTLSVFEADIDVAKAEAEGTGSTLYPKFDLELNGTVGEDIAGIEGNENRASALAVMTWNLYRGGGDQARQREFIYRHALAKERRAAAARQVEKDVRDTWAGMLSANERAQEYMKQAQANEKVASVYLDQFSLDRRTLLDVLDSQNELFVSRSNHVNALYTEIFGVYRMLALEGQLFKTLGLEHPREANLQLPATGK